MSVTKSYVSTPFLGMRGTGRWGEGQEPDTWRKSILYTQPNGDTVLTGILSMMGEETAPDYQWNWHYQKMPMQGGKLQAAGQVYTDTGLTVAVTAGVAAGTQVYVKMIADNTAVANEKKACANEFRIGNTVVLRFADHANGLLPDQAADTTGVVNGAPVINGTSSYVPVRLLEADQGNALSASVNITSTDEIYIIGSAYGEAGMPPTGVNYIPQNAYNYTQIFKTGYSVSNTMLAAPHRNFDNVKTAELEMARKLHGIELEKAVIWGKRGTFTDPATGETARVTGGLHWALRTFAPNNFFKFHLDSAWDQKEWMESGEDFIDYVLEQVSFTGGDDEVLGLCGNSALMAINKVIKGGGGSWELTKRDGWYGINVREWVTPLKTIMLKTHPLFNHMPSMRNTIILLKPSNMSFLPLPGRDTTESDVTPAGFDGFKGQILTEGGFEMSNLDEFAWISGIGLDNPV